ncbi:polysaccharide ABC transporter ATP-binding protein [Cytophagaceae bacterium DM2B3-1]|uniref:Polysaccharide ABC transporter ATP-binding protein n=1 Tax=Xanthocytophaga flava TaxID=3048013 RepID=A0ABT7CE34_9BACT|nr:polysaccharide ABC transporter ATP-binding protein [Xanthocytophaga flavus]MDJ1491950.1 polysaccharide ABC transporter ATP-binding protein [Xanthocytophaga flavus]
MSKVAIKVENLSKLYQIGAHKSGSLRESLTNKWKNIWTGKKSSQTQDFWALDNVSFEIKQGEAIGIIGKNGAGKSTLLKVLSRITEPTKGRIEVQGRIASLLEVGTGFHPELSGRENIYLNGTILGMTRKEIKSKFDEIVSFSGVEKFIDTPVKYYSSGMYVRLAFAVAAHLDPEILIIDEVLAVGDADFQKKCLGKMGEVASQGRTVLFVSHDMQAVSRLVNKVVYLKKGTVYALGEKDHIINMYLEDIQQKNQLIYQDLSSSETNRITFVELQTSKANNFHINGDPIKVRIKFYLSQSIKKTCITFRVFDNRGIACLDFSYFDNEQLCSNAGFHHLECVFPNLKLFMGKYTITAYFAEPPGGAYFQTIENICPFEVVMYGTSRGDWEWQPYNTIYMEDYSWQIVKNENIFSS